MVSHVRLEKEQNYQHQICLSCVTGIYGCRWKRYRRSTDPTTLYEKIWLGVVITSFAFMLMWLYFWLVAQNESDDFNWYMWESLNFWFDWFTLLYAFSVTTLVYIAILLILAIGHCFIGQQLYLHWLHKAVHVLVLVGCIITAAMLAKLWNYEYQLLAISLHVTAPILQIVLVVVLTTLTWPFAGIWYRSDNTVVMRTLMFISYAAIMVFFYLVPLFMDVPCVAERSQLPPPPRMMGHRGAEQIAPENTQISFEQAAANGIYGFESDVKISLDGVPFLMHDDTLERTTDVKQVFRNRSKERADTFTWEELSQLNAGSWFAKRDPFRTAKSISKENKEKFAEQKVMSLDQLMSSTIQYNKSVVFDLSCPAPPHPFRENCTEHVIDRILQSGIRQNQVWWLDDHDHEAVRRLAPGFILVHEGRGDIDYLHSENITKINGAYYEVSEHDIKAYANASITSNIYPINEVWLFSLYWCVGASSITTSACQVLKDVDTPIWHMTETTYLIAWVLVDAVSLVCVLLIFLLQRVRHPSRESNPESISLNSPRQKTFHHPHHHHHRKSDREVLYQSNEDTPAATPTGEGGAIGNMSVVMEDPVSADGPAINHHEVEMELE